MIINFEEITHELTEEEKGIIPLLVKGLEQHNPSNPIKEPDLVHVLNQVSKVRMTGARLRKCVNYIRSNGLLPLIATSNGYFVSYDQDIIAKQIKSLEQRARSIQTCSDGLKKFLK